LAVTNNLTWKKPRSIAIVIAWGTINASIVLQAFLNRRLSLEWFDLLFLFFVGIFAGVLLADVKTIVLGIFEALFLSIGLTYFCMILPVLVGNVGGFFQANVIYQATLGYIFRAFFPTAVFACFLGGMLGGFVEDLIL